MSPAEAARDVASLNQGEIPPASKRVELVARRELRVRVVDSGRRPLANIPVALALVGEIEQHGGLVVRSAAPDGIARFSRNQETRHGEKSDAHWCVYLMFPGAGGRFARVDPTDPPADPIELVAPELGRLVVKVDDARGRPVQPEGGLELFAWAAGEQPIGDMRSSTFPFKLPITTPGEVVIDPIAIGLRASVKAWLKEYALASVEGDGPRLAGETATLGIRIPRYGPVVIGRLVAADGAPIAGMRLSGVVVSDPEAGAHGVGEDFTTDSAGLFRFDASGCDVEDPSRSRSLEILGASQGFGVGGRARVALPVPFVEGEYDVGRVTYEAAPLVVNGRVVDSDGRPVAQARVSVRRSAGASNDGLRGAGPGDIVFDLNDERGTFDVHGFEAGAFVMSAVDPQGRESDPVRFTSGARDVGLVIRDCGALEGSLVKDAIFDMSQLGLFLRRADRGSVEDGDLLARISPASNGSFRWNRVPAGRVDVAVALGRSSKRPDIVLVVPGVEVEAGGTNRDPRLAGIDLRSRVTTFHIEAVDPDGKPVPRGTVTLLSADAGREPVLTVPLRAGIAELPSPRDQVDVDVRATGFLRERRLGLTSGARVELRRAIPVVLEFDSPIEPGRATAGIAIGVVLSAEDGPGVGGSDPQRVELDENGRASFLSSESGWFQVGLELSATLGPRAGVSAGTDDDVKASERWEAAKRRLATAFGRPTIEIPEAAGEQRVSVPLAPAARTILSDMLREFGKPVR
jgi:hypothetical protein